MAPAAPTVRALSRLAPSAPITPAPRAPRPSGREEGEGPRGAGVGARAPSSVFAARGAAGPPRGRAQSGARARRLRSPPSAAGQPRLTRSGALRGAGASGSSVPAGGSRSGRARRPRAGRAEEAEAGPGRGPRRRRAGAGPAVGRQRSGRGELAGVGPEPREPPQEVHAQAERPEGAEGAAPPRPRYPDSGWEGRGSRDRGAGSAGPPLGPTRLGPRLRPERGGPALGLSRPTLPGVTLGPGRKRFLAQGLLRIPVFRFAKSFENTDL